MPDASSPELRRALGTFDGVAVLVGITIGSGIYTTPYLIAGYFESYAQIFAAWLGVGALVVVGGLIYAELGTRLPSTGGEYVYISRCFGPFAGFVFGWAQLAIIRTSPAAGLALIAADYVGFLTDLGARGRVAVALGILVALGFFNYVGVVWAALFQKVTTVMKVAGLALFAVGGLLLLRTAPNLLGSTSPPVQNLGAVGNVVAALMLIVFTHTGFDRVGYVAGEMKDPHRVIPRTMLIGIAIVLVLYWSCLTIYHSVLGMDGIRATATPAAAVADVMVGPAGAVIVALLAIISAVGSINGTMMSATRVYFAMARDGLFFRWLDYVHPRYRTPSRAIFAHVAWAAVILLVRGSFEAIAAGMVFAILIFYGMTTLALVRLRREGVGGRDVFRVPLYPWLPGVWLISIVLLLVARATLAWQASLIDLAFVATGVPAWFLWARRRNAEQSPSTS